MSDDNYYLIYSTIELKFKNSRTRDISYNSFLPELYKSKGKSMRSKIEMKKLNKSLIFYIESTDITAFRATINDVISLGKIIENVLKLQE